MFQSFAKFFQVTVVSLINPFFSFIPEVAFQITAIINGKLIIIGLNIHSLSNKFKHLKVVFKNKFHILALAGTKLGSTFFEITILWWVFESRIILTEIGIYVKFWYMLLRIFKDIQNLKLPQTLRWHWLFQGNNMVGIDKYLILSVKTMAIAFMNWENWLIYILQSMISLFLLVI